MTLAADPGCNANVSKFHARASYVARRPTPWEVDLAAFVVVSVLLIV